MSSKSKRYIYVLNPRVGECGRMTLAHARRLVRQKRAAWEGSKVRLLSAHERIAHAVVLPTVAQMRAKGIPAVDVLVTKPRVIKWPARLTVIERARLANGNLPEDPAELRSFGRYPDKWSIAEMRRAARRYDDDRLPSQRASGNAP